MLCRLFYQLTCRGSTVRTSVVPFDRNIGAIGQAGGHQVGREDSICFIQLWSCYVRTAHVRAARERSAEIFLKWIRKAKP
jgi:hypothetical protein